MGRGRTHHCDKSPNANEESLLFSLIGNSVCILVCTKLRFERGGNLHYYCGEKIVGKFVLNGAFKEPSEFISSISID